MAKKNAPVEQDNLGFDNVEQTLTKTEQFLENNARQVGIAVAAVVAVVLAYFAYNTYIVEPKAKEGATEMAKAIKWFETDSMELALNGNGAYYGLLDIIDEFGGTDAGNSANYYAGVAYYTLGDYENAIAYMDDYDKSDAATSATAFGVIGDAFDVVPRLNQAIEKFKAS